MHSAADEPGEGPSAPRFYSFNNSNVELLEQTRLKIDGLLQQHIKGRLFSLTSYISQRRALIESNPHALTQEERTVLTGLDTAQRNIQLLNTEGSYMEDHKTAYKAFDRAYFNAREHYISRHARGIIFQRQLPPIRCSDTTSHHHCHRGSPPLTEALAVATMSRNLHSVPTVKKNERRLFSFPTSLSSLFFAPNGLFFVPWRPFRLFHVLEPEPSFAEHWDLNCRNDTVSETVSHSRAPGRYN